MISSLQLAGMCALTASPIDSRIALGSCGSRENPNFGASLYLVAELTTTNLLRTVDGRCLTAQVSAYIHPMACRTKDTQQQWTYNKRRQLVNVWSNYCAKHVTDPDPKSSAAGRQVMMAQNCTADLHSGKVHDSETVKFSQWNFVPFD